MNTKGAIRGSIEWLHAQLAVDALKWGKPLDSGFLHVGIQTVVIASEVL